MLWEKGVLSDGSDSLSCQVFSENHWKELKCMVLIFDDSVKEVSSREGMKRSVETSTLFKVI